jgi:hypothetical protein
VSRWLHLGQNFASIPDSHAGVVAICHAGSVISRPVRHALLRNYLIVACSRNIRENVDVTMSPFSIRIALTPPRHFFT